MRNRLFLLIVIAVALVSGRTFAAGISALPGYALDNGDVNGDWERDIGDPVYLLSHLFAKGRAPVPLAYCAGAPTTVENGDTNADGFLDIADGVRLLDWLYGDGPEPALPCPNKRLGNQGNPRVIPPQAKPHGKSYGEWAGVFWQWALAIPADNHPFFGGDCSIAQSGKVWKLVGLFVGSENDPPVELDCTVPSGTALFFPIINTECSNLEPAPYGCVDEETCLACNDAFYSADDVLSANVDGVDLVNLHNYRVQSGIYPIGPLPANNILGAPEGATGISLADGYYIMLAPLSKGEHTIAFMGKLAPLAPWFVNTVYHLTVE